MKPFNLTPSPRVLLVIIQTAMKPIDALCELVDNSIDSFRGGVSSVGANEIHIEIPTSGSLANTGDSPFIRVSDNGPGMTPDAAEKALTAGYSGQEQSGSLGLFGVGLNIATGKFARKTRLITATRDSQSALVVDLDLDVLTKEKNFKVQPMEKPKKDYFGMNESGTIIELSGRWPMGNTNHDFPQRLIQNGPGRLRDMIGRRYATYLRNDSLVRFNIFVGPNKCEPFEHCTWSADRNVPYSSYRIKAREDFDNLIKTTERCRECRAAVIEGRCTEDQSHSGSVLVEERVRGWIGVQRYDNDSHFGVDLIRNGRAIRILEKAAFFTFTDNEGQQIADYPIDGPFGRIVGEVHLDHVPVNFIKSDFERYTAEWQEAMEFLRGNSSLQARQPGAAENTSPMMKIFTGYRRVRKGGPGDLYMAELGADGKPCRISRDVEKDFFEKFKNKEEGYYDDSKWFEQVNVSATEPYSDCPECGGQILPSAEECPLCCFLIKTKKCSECEEKIIQSAEVCQHCGKSQISEGPWKCGVCGNTRNPPDSEQCRCGADKGDINPFDLDVLRSSASNDDVLSVSDMEIDLPGGGKSERFDLEVYKCSLKKNDLHLPAIIFRKDSEGKLTVFLDREHPLFVSLQMRPHYAVAEAAADSVYARSTSIAQGARKLEHNLIILTYRILEKYWGPELADDLEKVRGGIRSLLADIQEKMVDNLQQSAKDIFNAMSQDEIQSMVSAMQENKVDIGGMERMRESGMFMRYIPPSAVVATFKEYTSRFFGGYVWKDAWDIPAVPEEAVNHRRRELQQIYLNCLEDCVSFLRYQRPAPVVAQRARLSLEFLEQNFAP